MVMSVGALRILDELVELSACEFVRARMRVGLTHDLGSSCTATRCRPDDRPDIKHIVYKAAFAASLRGSLGVRGSGQSV